MPRYKEAPARAKLDGAEEAGSAKPKKSKKKLVVVVLAVALAAAGAWYFFLGGASDAHTKPEPGEVLPLEPIQVNLSGGHYLRLGLALQMSVDAHEPDGSKALDAAISVFSGRDMDQLVVPGAREQLKKRLMHRLEKSYEGEVLDVYFTDFVTQ